MSSSKRSARRAPLSSLSARSGRTERREADIDDDDCPICVAMRIGDELDWQTLSPSIDGGPPRVDPKILVPGARKALAKHKPAADVDVPFFSYGVKQDDGTFAEAAFSVDGAGRIFWTTSTRRTLISHLPLA